MGRKRFTAEQWQAWFEEFEQSGLTVQQFCKAKGTTANTFYNWRRRLSSGNGATFVSVLPVAAAAAEPIEVDLPCGATIRVPSSRHSLQPLLEVLLELGAAP